MEYYDAIASGYNELHEEEQLRKYGLIRESLDVRENETLLDIGCGTGLASRIFDCKIYGMDPSRKMLKEAKKNCLQKEEFVLAMGEHIPFKDCTFDAVICVTALHNFEAPRAALQEIKRVCKGRGALTVMKKAMKAHELKKIVDEVLCIDSIIEEDKDMILFFGIPTCSKIPV